MTLLKKIRTTTAVIFFVSLSSLFLDLYNITPQIYNDSILYLQFIPSLLRFTNSFSFISTGFIAIIIITLLFGRLYCSSICPIGIIQDLVSKYARRRIKGRKKKSYRYTAPHNILRYSILTVTAAALFSSIIFPVLLLDPYSNFGRGIVQLIKPATAYLNNLVVQLLEGAGIIYLYPVKVNFNFNYLLLFPFVYFTLLLYMAHKYGRLYCNTVCPVGVLLGLFSKLSILQLRVNGESCTECGLCEKVCKAGCIDSKNKEIDFDRCVACYNCITVCKSNSIKYRSATANKNHSQTDNNKRDFLIKTGTYLLTFTGIMLPQDRIIPKKKSTIPVIRENAVTPPGSGDRLNFTALCTACNLCISSCPDKVLQPSYLEYGILGLLQPYMEYSKGFCNYECNSCTLVCPTGAIMPLTKEGKKRLQLGKAIFIKKNCIVETEKTACGACSEHCPTKAVKMVNYSGSLKIPEVETEYCTGCGACEYACPVKPYKAIYVEGNLAHMEVKKRPEQKIEETIDMKEEFPF